MNYFKLSVLLFASLALSTPVLAKKNNSLDSAVNLSVYNAATQNPQTTFSVGDTIGYTVEALLPAEADAKAVDIDVTLSITIHGIDVPFELSQKLSGAIVGIDPATGTGTNLPGAFKPVSETGEFVVPSQLSGDSVTIKVKVSIEDIGSTTVQQSLQIN